MEEYRKNQRNKWQQNNPENIIDLTKDDEKVAQELQKQFEEEFLKSTNQFDKKEQENKDKKTITKDLTSKSDKKETVKIPDTSKDEEIARMLQQELEQEEFMNEEIIRQERLQQRDRELAQKMQQELSRERLGLERVFEEEFRNMNRHMNINGRDFFNLPNFPSIPNFPRIIRDEDFVDDFEDDNEEHLYSNQYYEGSPTEDYETLLQLDENNVKRPATKEMIEKTCQKFKIEKSPDSNCSICQDNFKKGDEALKLPCTHLFHSQCINPWFETSRKCPNCQKEIEKK